MKNLVPFSAVFFLIGAAFVARPVPVSGWTKTPVVPKPFALHARPALGEWLNLRHDLQSVRVSAPGLSPLAKAAAPDTFVVIQLNVDTWNNSQWTNSMQTLFSPDIWARIIGVKDQAWSGSAWGNLDSVAITYDSLGTELTRIGKLWDSTARMWENSLQITHSYQGDSLDVTVQQGWNTGTGAWENQERDSVRFDSWKDPVSILVQTWTSGTWLDTLRISTEYSASRKPVRNQRELWSPLFRQWAIAGKDTLMYDASDLLIRQSGLESNPLGILDSSWNDLYSYGTFQKPDSIVYQLWDGSGSWVNDWKDIYAYASTGKDSAYYGQVWTGAQWLFVQRSFSTLDSNGNVIEERRHIFNSSTGNWYNYQRLRSAYVRITPGAAILPPLTRAGRIRVQRLGTLFLFTGLEGVDRIQVCGFSGRKIAALTVRDRVARWNPPQRNPEGGWVALFTGPRIRRAMRLGY